ncbi:serine protease snake-like [Coccinella septempunctata]|uniref:serine protease snake-like n=1 Tax=Coccinella septempunctata TaxID=41139 RepID=UPI001D084662|nr:serine protease snake-like [Coccinella septempunctata]
MNRTEIFLSFFDFLFGFTIAELKCREYLARTKFLSRTFAVPLPLIIYGDKTIDGEFPHMAHIGYKKNGSKEIKWACGGSLISELFILTAAHCTDASEFGMPRIIRLGTNNVKSRDNVQRRSIVQIIPHPKRKGYYHDIALLRLNRPVIFSYYIRPACLNTCKECQFTEAIATGFGIEEFTSVNMSDHLMKTNLKIYSNKNCSKIYAQTIKEILPLGVRSSQICAGSNQGNDTCHGDSGGPLQIKLAQDFNIYRIIGITSFGLFCGQPNTPSFYTRISRYVDWIEKVVWKRKLFSIIS